LPISIPSAGTEADSRTQVEAAPSVRRHNTNAMLTADLFLDATLIY